MTLRFGGRKRVHAVIEVRLSRVGEIVEAEVPAELGDCAVEGVCSDSRKVQKGDLFFALSGENFDAGRVCGARGGDKRLER